MSSLGDKLKELRGTRSFYEIGKACKLIPNDISRYEQAKRVPSSEVLDRLAAYFDVTYDELRKLYYDDLFNADSRERKIVLAWAKDNL